MGGNCDLCGKEDDDLQWAGNIRVCLECKIVDFKVREGMERERKKREKQRLIIYSIFIPVGGILIVLAIVQFSQPPLIECSLLYGCQNLRLYWGGWLSFFGILFLVGGIWGIGKIRERRNKLNNK
jgi:hypothetical protein